MAKNDVKINVKLDDNGSLKEVGKSAHSARRQIGGVAKTASAGGKQFSKMSQGISGGLVPAYAQLAATLFAVDALFRALKQSAELRVQREGMMAFAASTGTAMQGVAQDMQAASGGLLDFKEAASSAAIGIAAGLNADQMNQITVAAKNASIALGRNFADSYDRVLKGIVKGEPELLDELGIILRLETATREYAQAMGLNQDKLTAWQRSQAVFNNVIGQATEKYAAMGEGIPVSQIERLATKLEDVKNTFMEAFAPIAEFFAGVFASSVQAAVAILMVFSASIINKLIPSLGDLKNSLAATKAGFTQSMGSIGGTVAFGAADVKKAWTESGKAGAGARTQKAAQAFGPTKSKTLGALAGGKELTKGQSAALNRMLKNAERQYKRHGKIVTGYLKGEDIKRVRHLKRSMKLMQNPVYRFAVRTKSIFKGVTTTFKVGFKTIGAVAKATFKGMSIAAKAAGFAMNAAMKGAGLIGVALLIWDIFKALKDNIDKILIFMGNMLQKLGNVIAGWAAKLENTFPRLAGVLSDLSKGAIEKGQELVDKGEKQSEQLKLARATKERAEAFQDLSDGMAKSREEMRKMITEKRSGMSAGAEALWSSNFAATAGSKMQGDVAAIAGMFDTKSKSTAKQKQTAIRDLIANLKQAGEVSPKYMELAESLERMATGGHISKEMIQELGKELETTNGGVGAVGNSLKELGNLNESYNRSISELNKNLGQTRWDRVKNDLDGMVNNMSVLVEKGAGKNKLDEQALQLAKDLYGEDTARAMTNKQFYEFLLLDQAKYNDLIEKEYALKTRGNALKLMQIESGRYKGTLGKMIQRELTIKNNLLAVDQARADVAAAQAVFNENIGKKGEDAALRELELTKQSLKLAQTSYTVHKETTTVMGQLQQTLAVNFENMFGELIKGTKSLKDALRDLFANTMQWLAQLLAKMAAAKILSFMFPGAGALLGLEKGGIYPMAKGGIKGYQYGGVATQPTYLVGEGKQNEAVVPLPDNRTIPVTLHGNTGGTNNVTVNIDASGGQTSTSVGSEQARVLGQLVSSAVQAEIVDQKRPGGLLSPYGDGDY